jgi:hypothetical protein
MHRCSRPFGYHRVSWRPFPIHPLRNGTPSGQLTGRLFSSLVSHTAIDACAPRGVKLKVFEVTRAIVEANTFTFFISVDRSIHAFAASVDR